MNIALDLNDTITADPIIFKNLADSLIKNGHKVYVVSAIEKKNEHLTKIKIKASRVPYTEICLVFYENYDEIPFLKLPILLKKRIDLFIDDNPENRKIARKYGIFTLGVDKIKK